MDEMISEFYNERFLQTIVATVLIFLTCLFVSWSWLARRATGRVKLRLPPGPRGLPLLGSLLSLGKYPHEFFLKLSQKYGPVMFVRMGLKPCLVVCNSDIMKEVLQTNDLVFASRPHFCIPTILFYDNLDMGFAPYGPHWRLGRKISNFQLLTTSRIRQFLGMIETEIMATIQLVLQGCESGKPVNITNLFSALIMNVLTQMMWRKRHCYINSSTQGEADPDKFKKLFGAFAHLGGANNIADFLPFLAPLVMTLSGWEREAKTVHKEMDEFLEEIICEREEQLSKQTSLTTTEDDDFLDVMLKLTNQPAGELEQLSRKAMKAFLLDIVTAGTGTTSSSLDWGLAELMRRPDMLRKAQDELNRVVGADRLVTEADIPNLPYIGAIVKETLRRRPPGPLGIPHFSVADCKVGGYDVPANTMVVPNFYAIHHDAASWDKPMEFNPDRFLESDVDFRGRDFRFLPFGSGRRICPGMNLGAALLHLGFAQLLHTVNFSLPDGQTPDSMDMTATSGLTLHRAQPLHVIGKPRLSTDIISSSFPLA